MQDNKKAVKAGLGYTIGNYLLKGISFLSIPLFARLLETREYGIYNTFIAYESILFILIGFAIHSSFKSAKNKYSNIEENNNSISLYDTYVSDSYLFIFINTVVLIIVSILFKNVFVQYFKLSYDLIVLLILYSFSTAVLLCFNADLGLKYEYRKYIIVSAINAVCNISLSVLLMLSLYSNNRVKGRILGTVIPPLLISIAIIISSWKKATPTSFKKLMRWGIKYSAPIVPHGISQVILSQFDRIMISRMVGDVESGIYSFAYNIFSILNVTYTSLDNVWGPWFFNNRKDENYKDIKNFSSIYIWLMLFVTCIVMLISPEMVIILGSNKYNSSILCVMPIVAAGFFSFLYTLPSAVEYYHEKTNYIAMGTIVSAIVNISLNYYLIPKYGFLAAAYSTLFTYFLYFVIHYLLAIKIEKKNLFSNVTVLLSSFTLIAVMFISMFLKDYLVPRLILSVVLLILVIVLDYFKIGIIKYVYNSIRKKFSSL